MLVGLIAPTSGTAKVCGYDVQTEPIEVRKRLAYVPDFPFLYDKLTPWEFLRFTGQLFHMNEEDIETRTRDLIPRFSLEPYLRKSIESLSHGTRQRIAIVSALMHNPEVFVLDEPMVGLIRIINIFSRKYSRNVPQGMTVFLSTHQLERGRGSGRSHWYCAHGQAGGRGHRGGTA